MSDVGRFCVEWSLEHVGLKEELPGSNTGPLIRKWLRNCIRKDTGENLHLTSGSWCACFACAAPIECGFGVCFGPTADVPHGCRASGVELQADAMDCAAWRGVKLARTDLWVPKVGDLAIWDRGIKGKPETAWQRHVSRVIHCWPQSHAFETVGGNEEGTVRVTMHAFMEPTLLGFIEYPREQEGMFDLDEREREEVLAHVAMSLDALTREIAQ